ncbi:hypothetical protein EIM50_15930 [Pseudoxanthomonas sp. SGD-10]|nr:hypothetical protein EIM50_15930 [Pseudoxanthomonas sp. SGD-10]
MVFLIWILSQPFFGFFLIPFSDNASILDILFFILEATFFVLFYFSLYHVLKYYIFPKLQFKREESFIRLKKEATNENILEFLVEDVSEVHLKHMAESYHISIYLNKSGKVYRYAYEIADDYFWGIFNKKKRRTKHKKDLRIIFKGVKLKEYQKGKYVRF